MLPCILECIPACRPILSFLGGLGAVVLFLITLLLSPLWLLFYLLCWVRARITKLVYRARAMDFLDGRDAFFGQEITSTNCLINVACIMEGSISPRTVKEVMLNRVVLQKNDEGHLLFPKFSRYVALKAGYLVWCDEEKFSIDNHVLEYRGKLPKTEADLTKIVTGICNQVLPPQQSGWQIILIPSEGSLDTPPNDKYFVRFPQSCMLCRVHHSIADGLALTRLIAEQLAENDATLKDTTKKMARMNPQPQKSLATKCSKVGKFFYGLVFAPFVQLKQALTKDENLLHGPKLTGKKLVGWTPPISLQMVKDIKNATGTTVNDVIMACLAGALRRFFIARQAKVPEFLRAAIPVSLQGPTSHKKLLSMGNALSFVIANLPTGEMDVLERLKMTKYVMDNLKRAPDVLVNHWMLKYLVNVLPNSLTRRFINTSPVSVIFSNVPGPTRKMYFRGHKFTSVIPFLPHRGSTGFAICLFSYSGDIRMSVSVDKAIISKMDDVTAFLKGFFDELQHLHSLLKLRK